MAEFRVVAALERDVLGALRVMLDERVVGALRVTAGVRLVGALGATVVGREAGALRVMLEEGGALGVLGLLSTTMGERVEVVGAVRVSPVDRVVGVGVVLLNPVDREVVVGVVLVIPVERVVVVGVVRVNPVDRVVVLAGSLIELPPVVRREEMVRTEVRFVVVEILEVSRNVGVLVRVVGVESGVVRITLVVPRDSVRVVEDRGRVVVAEGLLLRDSVRFTVEFVGVSVREVDDMGRVVDAEGVLFRSTEGPALVLPSVGVTVVIVRTERGSVRITPVVLRPLVVFPRVAGASIRTFGAERVVLSTLPRVVAEAGAPVRPLGETLLSGVVVAF